jgi:hypothetical protein
MTDADAASGTGRDQKEEPVKPAIPGPPSPEDQELIAQANAKFDQMMADGSFTTDPRVRAKQAPPLHVAESISAEQATDRLDAYLKSHPDAQEPDDDARG